MPGNYGEMPKKGLTEKHTKNRPKKIKMAI